MDGSKEIPKTKTVYVDIGHCTSGEKNPLGVGGSDRGFQGPGYTECDINQGVGRKLMKELDNMGFYVVPTWNPDKPPAPVPKADDLQRRIDTVNRDVAKYGDDSIYISVHHDSDKTGRGGQCVYFDATRPNDARKLAETIQGSAWPNPGA